MNQTFGYFKYLWLVLALTVGCSSEKPIADDQSLVHHCGKLAAMGVEFKYELYAKPSLMPEADRIIAETLHELEEIFSDYRKHSEVNRLSESAPHSEPVTVSPHLWKLCGISTDISSATDGAFDITVGPLSHLWRAAIKRNRLPDESKILAARVAVGMERLQILPESKVRLTAAGMQLDFGGIAKGYAADVILHRLGELGIEDALIDASGDLAVRGLPPKRDHWLIKVAAANSVPATSLCLRQGAVATSGDAFQSLQVDGVHYSHIVDPRTGWACSRSCQVTVFACDATTADALASAFSVLDPARAVELADSMSGVAVRIVYRQDDNRPDLAIKESIRFKELFAKR